MLAKGQAFLSPIAPTKLRASEQRDYTKSSTQSDDGDLTALLKGLNLDKIDKLLEDEESKLASN